MSHYQPTIGAQSYHFTLTANGDFIPVNRTNDTENQIRRVNTHINAIERSNKHMGTVLTCTHIDGRDEQKFVEAAETRGWKIVKIIKDPKISGECGGYVRRVNEMHMLVTPNPELEFFDVNGRRILDWYGNKI